MDADLYIFCELVDDRDSEQADDVSLIKEELWVL